MNGLSKMIHIETTALSVGLSIRKLPVTSFPFGGIDRIRIDQQSRFYNRWHLNLPHSTKNFI